MLRATRVAHATRAGARGVASSMRSHTCGELRLDHDGLQVTLCGWVISKRKIGSHLVFIPLRDGHGVTQVVFDKDNTPAEMSSAIERIPTESVVQVTGRVRQRPAGQGNQDLATGLMEVVAERVQVLNECGKLPFAVDEKHARAADESGSELRQRYRYLALRSSQLASNLRLRAKVASEVRLLLERDEFVEVETPTLFRRTPEGAREFIVPTRDKGLFYALPQSPQQYKQLLMAAGVDRYYQFARCYRDEDLRADRQPEFTQIDLEMSFVGKEDVQVLVERLCGAIWRAAGHTIPAKFPRMTYQDAMASYGVDKPDVRFDMKIVDTTRAWARSSVAYMRDADFVGAINLKGYAKHVGRKDIDMLQASARDMGWPGLAFISVKDGVWTSPLSKQLDDATRDLLRDMVGIDNSDVVLLLGGARLRVLESLGKFRLKCASLLEEKGEQLRDPTRFEFLWIEDFPLFTKSEGGALEATHHPFTAPVDEDVHLLTNDPEKVRGQHYDIVVNGVELGGGSVRIHHAATQMLAMELLGANPEGFQHLLSALGHGCPPHAGIALGFDRLMAVLVNAASLREVIAFPKGFSGKEPMTRSPCPVPRSDLLEYGLQLAPE